MKNHENTNKIPKAGIDNQFSDEDLLISYNLFFKYCPTAILVFDKDMKYLFGTEITAPTFGFSTCEEIKNLNIKQIFSRIFKPEWIEKTINNCKTSIKENVHISYQDKVSLINNQQIIVKINITPVFDSRVNSQGFIFTLDDISEIVEEKETAEESSEAKSLFLANLSHEIRTPMNIIKGLSELLLLEDLEGSQLKYINSIVEASNSLLRIIDNLLNFSNIERGELNIVTEPYDLASFISAIVNMTYIRSYEKGLDYIVDIDPNLPSMLEGDEIRIKQILFNILNNAIDFTDIGLIKLNVWSEIQSNNMARIYFSVEDTGRGISNDEMDTLFEAFAKSSEYASNLPGIGLGLSIGKQLLNIMGGEIYVKSEFGKGSTFTFWVDQEIISDAPLAYVPNPEKKNILLIGEGLEADHCANILKSVFLKYDYTSDEKEIERLTLEGGYTHCIYFDHFGEKYVEKYKDRFAQTALISINDFYSFNTEAFSDDIIYVFKPIILTDLVRSITQEKVSKSERTRSGKIGKFHVVNSHALVVDDNELNLMISSEILRRYGFIVEDSNSGILALDNCKNNKYDIIFMDHMMPGMDGVETTEKIRIWEKVNNVPRTPIIALTANAVSGMREFFLDNDLDDYISKPIDLKDLDFVIHKWIDRANIIYDIDLEDERYLIDDEKSESSVGVKYVIAVLKTLGVDANSSIKRLNNDSNAYLNILKGFIHYLPNSIEQLDSYYLEGKWYEFSIDIHAMKGSLANIGANKLSNEARNLEIAAKDMNYKYINSNFPTFIGELKLFQTALSELDYNPEDKDKIKVADKKDFAEINFQEFLKDILNDINLLDNLSALNKLDSLKKYNSPEEIEKTIKNIKYNLEIFNYDEAIKIIESNITK